MSPDSASPAVAPTTPPPSIDEITLRQPLKDYTADSLWRDFGPEQTGGPPYARESSSLFRWCAGNKRCDFKVRATEASRVVTLDSVPANGVVMAFYRPTSSNDDESMYRMQRNVRGYFLVITPGAGGSAKWQLVGVRTNGKKHILPAEGTFGEFKSCDHRYRPDSSAAGFESCERKQELHELAQKNGTSFGAELEAYRATLMQKLEDAERKQDANLMKTLVGGPYDFAWTSCAAGCCRATPL
ncbi:MAG: hypothetical protein IT359_17100 [Gemmatimonadaceae bacterium]|nr:hypothetical protein [Gemmatimonadaceae bacterium]